MAWRSYWEVASRSYFQIRHDRARFRYILCLYRCQKGPPKIILQIWAKNSTFPKMGILEPKHGSISPTASRSAYDLPNARPVPSRPLSHPYGPHRPLSRACRPHLRAEAPSPPPQTASDAFAPSEVATTDLAPNARPVRLLASPHLPDLGKPTGHHQLVHRVLLHNRSTVVLLRTYAGCACSWNPLCSTTHGLWTGTLVEPGTLFASLALMRRGRAWRRGAARSTG